MSGTDRRRTPEMGRNVHSGTYGLLYGSGDSEKRSNENGRERPGSRKERHLPGVVVKK